MSQKWICNKCGFETTEKPKHKNETCKNCNKGRFQVWNRCECGEWFHPQRIDQKYCSKECMYKYRETGGKKERNILIRKEQGLPFAPFAVKSLGQYTNTKAENLFIVRKNVGLKEGEK